MKLKDTKKFLPFMAAAANGFTIQVRSVNPNSLNPTSLWYNMEPESVFDNQFEYRIKPTESYRPWTPEEVPVGCQFRGKSSGEHRYRSMILGVHDGAVVSTACLMGNKHYIDFENCLANYEWARECSMVWKPCGVLIES